MSDSIGATLFSTRIRNIPEAKNNYTLEFRKLPILKKETEPKTGKFITFHV